MGDICNMNDLERFMRSEEGRAEMDRVRDILLNGGIVGVAFESNISEIMLVLDVVHGLETKTICLPIWSVDELRSEFEEAIEREYFVDYPERKQEEEDKELQPLFGNGSLEDRLAAFEKLEEEGDAADRAIAERMVMYVTFWYSGGATEAADFERFEKEFGVIAS